MIKIVKNLHNYQKKNKAVLMTLKTLRIDISGKYENNKSFIWI